MHVVCEELHCRASLKRPHPSRWLRLPLELRTDSLRRPSSGAAAKRFAAEPKFARFLAWCRAGMAYAGPGIEFAGRCSTREHLVALAARAAGESLRILKREANGMRRTTADNVCSRVSQVAEQQVCVAEQHYQYLSFSTDLPRPRRAKQMRA